MNVPGLSIQKDIITPETETAIIDWLDKREWSNALSRRTQHYGYEYQYQTTELKSGPPFEGVIADIAKFLIDQKIMDRVDQCIVNEYYRDQGIGKHIDGKRGTKPNIFGPVIVSISLGEDTNIIFSRGNQKEEIFVPRRCLLVMTGDSRYEWTHEIPRWMSVNTGSKNIKKSENYRRISLTFRSLA